MLRQLAKPISGKAIRIAPAIGGVMAAHMWKIYAQGDEVYAGSRIARGIAKISVHSGGQIQTSYADGDRTVHAGLRLIVGSQWRHALEWRFLLSSDAFRPRPEPLRKKKDKAYLIDVPSGNTLVLNLIIASSSATDPDSLPAMFGGARALWSMRLRGGCPATLLVRVVPMDAENTEKLRHIRYERNPHANFETEPKDPPYVEIRNTEWGEGGNIMFIVPMGAEGYRVIPPRITRE